MYISWYYKSLVLKAKGDFQAAEAAALRAIAIHPVHTRSYLALRDALMAQGKKKMAIKYLNHAYEIVPNELVISRAIDNL